jgi:hypothetical protein
MALHLQKLCVGAESIDDLRSRVEHIMRMRQAQGLKPEHCHTTRMTPKRRDEVLDGGSLYWVIKGKFQARQKILDLREFKDENGTGYCDIVLEPRVVSVRSRAKRPFQGWRYMRAEDAPADKGAGDDAPDLPDELADELRRLGLL